MAKSAILAVKIIGDAKSAQQALAGTEQATGRLSKMGGMVKGALIGAGAAAGAFAVKLGVDSVKAAADLEQSVGAIDAVFKGGAGQMHAYAATAATTVGLTKNEYNELGTLIGAQLKNGGTAMSELGTKTNQLIGVGADLSAMFGGTTKEAVEALSSALKGERDPIEKYGVTLNQAKIDAEAAALGFKKVGGSFDTQAQQAATLSLIMKQTKDAHGAFGRESDTLAHKQQVLSAQIGNLKASLGQALLPTVTRIVGAFSSLVTQVGPLLGPALAQLSAALARIWAAAQPLVTQLAGALMPTLRSLWSTAILPLANALTTQLGPILRTLAGALIPTLVAAWRTITPALLTAAQAIAPFVTALGQHLLPIIRGLLPVVQTVWGQVAQVIRAALTVITAVIRTATAILRGDWGAAWNGIKATTSAVWNLIKTINRAGLNSIASLVRAAMTAVRGIFTSAWNTIKSATAAAWSAISSRVRAGLSSMTSSIRGGMSSIRSTMTSAWNSVKSTISSAWNGITSAASSGVGRVKSIVSGMKSSLVSIVNGLGPAMASAGRAIINSLVSGITAGIGRVTSAMRSVVNAARKLLPNSPAAEGPFSGTGWGGWGEAITNELAAGLIRQATTAARAANTLMTGVHDELETSPRLNLTRLATRTTSRATTSQAPIHITVQGAVDPDSTARQIIDLLNTYGRRTGRLDITGGLL